MFASQQNISPRPNDNSIHPWNVGLEIATRNQSLSIPRQSGEDDRWRSSPYDSSRDLTFASSQGIPTFLDRIKIYLDLLVTY